MKFTQELPVWLSQGIKPPESLITDGWKASQKPPADYFNWFFSKTHSALKELQDNATHLDDFNKHKYSTTNPHEVTAVQVGLGNVLNQKQATKVEFDAHDQDSVRHITATERTTWNGKAEKNHTQPWITITGVPDATIAKKGIVKLTDSVVSTDILTAATPNSVKSANDNANSAKAAAAMVDGSLSTHKSDYKNPHKVTATQVGAYSKNESDDLFINKTEAENGLFVERKTDVLAQDWNDFVNPGMYSVWKPTGPNMPTGASYGDLIVFKTRGTVAQVYSYNGRWKIRTCQGSPAVWTDWREVAFTKDVVNLTEPQSIGGIKNFIDIPLVNEREIALKEDTYIYKKSGLDEVELAYKSAFREETNITLIRKGDKVDAYLRVNIADTTKLKTAQVPIFKIPDGFKIDLSIRESFWNIALTVTQYTHPQGNYGALYEMDAKGIRFGSDRTGNHYVRGSWHTADSFPVNKPNVVKK